MLLRTIWIENIADFEKSWEQLISTNAETIYPAHGKPFPKSDLAKYKDIKILIADKYYPSTQKCSCCGNFRKMDIKDRIYTCNYCSLVIDRDLNSAINLANYK